MAEIINLTPRESTAIVRALNKAKATDEERRIFFEPEFTAKRIIAWIEAIRRGEVTMCKTTGIVEGSGGDYSLPCTD